MDKSKTGLLDASELKPTTVSEIAEIQKLRTDAETKEPNKRGHFGSTFEYIFATVGNAIGLGNVWRFPYEVYEGGGAAFFIPFVLMLFLIGVPLLTLEGAVGQYSGQSGCIALRRMVPLARGLGWQFTLLAYLLSFYYAFLTALVLRYFFSAIASDGWEKCGESELGYFFNTENCYTTDQFKTCRLQDNGVYTFWNNTCVTGTTFCTMNKNICKDRSDSCSKHLMSYANRTHCKNMTDSSEFEYVRYENAIKFNTAAEEYLKYEVLAVGDNPSWSDYGSFKWDIFLCLLCVWICTWAGVVGGANILGKIMVVAGMIPFFILLAMLLNVYNSLEYDEIKEEDQSQASIQPGAGNGLKYFVVPDFSKGFKLKTWNKAVQQSFFSLSIGSNQMIHFSSFNRFYSDIPKNCVMISIADFGMSILSGLVVFMTLGFHAHYLGINVDEVVEGGFGLAFVTFPQAAAEMPGSRIWASLFFLLLYIIAVNSIFSMLEVICGSLMDEFQIHDRRKSVVTVFSIGGFICGLSMVFERGVLMQELLDSAASMIFVWNGFLETILIVYVYGYFRLESDCEEMFGGMKNVVLRWYLRITTCLITPLILTWVIVMSLLQFRGPKYESYTFEWPLSVLWCLIILGITSPTIAGAIYQIVKTVYIDKRSWKDLFRTSPEWGPAPDALEKEMTMGFGHDYEIAQKKIDGALLHAIRLRRDDIKRSSADAETEPSKETKVAKGPSASEAKAPLEA